MRSGNAWSGLWKRSKSDWKERLPRWNRPEFLTPSSASHAVQAWVAQADEAAVRTTRDVDILLRRADFPAAVAAMQSAGFTYRHVKGIDMFLDGPGAKARDAVHVIFAGEKVQPEDPMPAPDISESEAIKQHRTLRLDALVRMKLTSFRRKDRMHLLRYDRRRASRCIPGFSACRQSSRPG